MHSPRSGSVIMRCCPRSASATAVLLGLVLLVVAGCGAGSRSGPPPPQPAIGFVLAKTTEDFAREMDQGYRAGAQMAGGVQAMVTGTPTDDGPQQVELFKQLSATAHSGIAVAPSAPELFAGPMAQAAGNGLPVITVGGRPAPGAEVKLLVSNDSYALGQMLADETANRLPPNTTGTIVLGSTSPAHPGLDQRGAGMRDQLVRRLPSARVVGPFDTQLDDAPNLDAWRLLAAANPKAVAFLGTADIDAYNLARIKAESHGTWLAGGFGVDPRTLQGIKERQLDVVISPEHFLTAAGAGWVLAEHARGARPLPQGWIVIPGLAITSDNVEEIIRRQSSEANKFAWAKPQIEKIVNDPTHFLRPLDQAR